MSYKVYVHFLQQEYDGAWVLFAICNVKTVADAEVVYATMPCKEYLWEMVIWASHMVFRDASAAEKAWLQFFQIERGTLDAAFARRKHE